MKSAPWGPENDDALARRQEERARALHLQRIRTSRPQVDSSIPPATFRLSNLRSAKKNQVKEDKQREIEADNDKLYQKIKVIFEKGSGNPSVPKFPSSIDVQPLLKGEALYSKRSLNEAARKKEQSRIKRENKQLMDRMRNGKNIQSSYSRDSLAGAEKCRSQYVRNISKAHRRRQRMPSCEATSSGKIKTPLLSAEKDIGIEMTVLREDGKPIQLRTAQQIRRDIACSIHAGGPIVDYERSLLFKSDERKRNDIHLKKHRLSSSKDGEYVLRYFGAK